MTYIHCVLSENTGISLISSSLCSTDKCHGQISKYSSAVLLYVQNLMSVTNIAAVVVL